MKKFFFSAFVMLTSFVLFSFTMVNKTQGVYDTVTGNLVFNSGNAASFTQYNTSGTDKDVKWKDWHKNWTSLTEASDIESISEELASIQP